MTPERFGPYLLLKKLAEDPLGEVFRAGRLASGSVEQVVLLRVLNGSAIDGRSLWPAIGERTEIQKALRNPNIGNGVDLGEVQGLPYVAYDYVSGKNLGIVLDQIVKRSYPMPADHALLLGERLALGLAVAHETRAREGRLVHGFLVPPLVMLSSEGETRILGFEVGQDLRAQLAGSPALRAEFGRYLSPEAQRGAAPSPADDIYSLGAILLELLLGHSLPSPLSDDYSPGFPQQVEHVTQHGPKGIGGLVGQSLAPAGDRLGDVVSWHKALTQLMVEGGHKSTTFNLAFFMHSLFRDDIERESEELEAERGLDVSQLAEAPTSPPRPQVPPPSRPATPASEPAAVEPTVPPTAGETLADVEGVLSATPAAAEVPDPRVRVSTAPPPPSSAAASGRRRVLGPTLALVLILLGAAGKWLWDEWQERRIRPEASPVETESIPAETQPPPGANDLDSTPPDALDDGTFSEGSTVSVEEIEAGAGVDLAESPEPAPDPEELIARLDQIVDERTRAVEEALRNEYDREIEALRAELQDARERSVESASAKSAEPGDIEPPPAIARPERSPSQQRPPARDMAADEEAPTRVGEIGEAGRDVEARREPPAPDRSEEEDTGSGRGDSAPEPAEPTAAESPVIERVRLGQMVEPGPGVVPPSGVECPPLEYPPIAQRLGQETVVVVRVLVDESGEVRQAQVPQRYPFGFDDAARENARKCSFVNPPTKNGVRVRMWHAMAVRFQARP